MESLPHAVEPTPADQALTTPPLDADSLARLPPDLADDVELVRSVSSSGTVLEACCAGTGMGFAAIARVTSSHWVACDVRDRLEFGLGPGGELPVRTTLCDEVITDATEIVIEDVATDATYAQHPCPAAYGFRSYVSVPIRLDDGTFFGTLCALDPEPRVLDESVLVPIRLFASLIAQQIDSRRRLTETRRALADERDLATLREQFIAVVGHDLRNPLGSIDANAQLIDLLGEDEAVREAAGAILRSSARMAGLIANLMDFARGRLGGGIDLGLEDSLSLGAALEQVVRELTDAYPERHVEATFEIRTVVRCDPARVGQLLSNLVGNAITHGDGEQPVRVHGWVEASELRLSVENAGKPIPPETLPLLFEPFRRPARDHAGADLSARPSRDGGGPADGLGLGLHIAAQIAAAHGGQIDVESDAGRTVFMFSMPVTENGVPRSSGQASREP